MEREEEVSQGAKRSLCSDGIVENGEKKVKIAHDLSGVSETVEEMNIKFRKEI